MTRLQSYIGHQWLRAFLLVLLIFCAAIFMVDMLEQSRTVGARVDVSLLNLAELAVLKLPMLVGEVLGFIFLIATLLAYAGLGRRKELPVIQTSGLSSFGVILPAAALTGLLSLANLTLINPIGALGAKQFEIERAALLDETPTRKPKPAKWVDRSGESRLLITATPSPEGVKNFDQFSAMELSQSQGFVRRVSAETALWREGEWQLARVRIETLDAEPFNAASMTLVSAQDPSSLIGPAHTRKTVSLWNLPGYIGTRSHAGLSTDRYEMRFFELLASPIFHLFMTLLGALACLRLDRLGRTALRITVACVSALGLYLVIQFAISLGATGLIPPLIAAFAPPAAAMMIALFFVTASEH